MNSKKKADEELQILRKEAEECQRCELSENRTNVVGGAGTIDADVMFVGEGPGFTEDKTGIPFTGAAGKTLDKLLIKAGLERDKVYITNVVLCRPPQNRDPLPAEINACSHFLKKHIRIIKPKLIVTLGRFASRVLLKRSVGISRAHGELKDSSYGGWHCKLFISYHPAAALYGADAAMKLEEDFEKLGEVVKKLDEFKTAEQTTL